MDLSSVALQIVRSRKIFVARGTRKHVIAKKKGC